MKDREAVITSVVRTPVGGFLGAFKDLSAPALCATAIREALKRSGISGADIEDAVIGNVIGAEPGGNPARVAVLAAGLPIETPACTVNMNCASGLKSVALAAAMIRSGEANVLLAGGMESMSGAPYALRQARNGFRLGHGQISDMMMEVLDGMGMTAERLAAKYSISRQEQDQFALESQMKAAKAQAENRFAQEIVPVSIPQKKKDPIVVSRDEAGRPDTTIEKLASLKPAFKADGSVTAGNASSINDGAAAMVIMSAAKAASLGAKPLARIKAFASAGCDPEIMGIGPVPATKRLLKQTGMALSDFDLVELNEAFAAQSLAVLRELPVDRARLNVNGGAIALGHPIGATGSILVARLVHEMKRRGAANGLITLCVGGGQGMALALENL